MKKIIFSLIMFILITTAIAKPIPNTVILSQRGNETDIIIDTRYAIRGVQFNLDGDYEVVGQNGLSISNRNGLYLVYRLESNYSVPPMSVIATIQTNKEVNISNVKVVLDNSYEAIQITNITRFYK